MVKFDQHCYIYHVYIFTYNHIYYFPLLGYNMGYDDIVIKGNLEERKFCAYYCKGDDVIAMASLMCDPAASEAAEKWYNGQSMKKADLE